MSHLPKFSLSLLHPRYWPAWLGIGLLWLVVQLPYPLIYRLGHGLGRLSMHFCAEGYILRSAILSSAFLTSARHSVMKCWLRILNLWAWG